MLHCLLHLSLRYVGHGWNYTAERFDAFT
jgi:hypothetical protein